MRRVLVTGATGFLGRNVLAALEAANGVEPVAACRTPSRLGSRFNGEVRAGDLRDPDYRRTVVKDVDVVCHAGTWSSMWGHQVQERTHFFEPACDLAEQAIRAGADPVLPGSSPFLTRSLVHVAGDWFCPGDYAARKAGYIPRKDWRTAVRETLTELKGNGVPMASTRSGRVIDVGQVLAEQKLVTVSGDPLPIPDPERLTHLQFRRFAGCPICNLHLRSIIERHDEIVAAGIREIAVFHSPEAEVRVHQASVPFAVVADPDKRLYRQFGVEAAPRALLDPRAWLPAIRGVVHKRRPWRLDLQGGPLGLPADFLIDSAGRVLALKYGTHAYDQWTVDEVLALTRGS